MKNIKIFLGVIGAATCMSFGNFALADQGADSYLESSDEMEIMNHRPGHRRGRDRGGSFSVSRMGAGVVDCRDSYIGGTSNSFVTQCVDIGNGRNHWCTQISRSACLAEEGPRNHGTPGCLAYCGR